MTEQQRRDFTDWAKDPKRRQKLIDEWYKISSSLSGVRLESFAKDIAGIIFSVAGDLQDQDLLTLGYNLKNIKMHKLVHFFIPKYSYRGWNDGIKIILENARFLEPEQLLRSLDSMIDRRGENIEIVKLIVNHNKLKKLDSGASLKQSILNKAVTWQKHETLEFMLNNELFKGSVSYIFWKEALSNLRIDIKSLKLIYSSIGDKFKVSSFKNASIRKYIKEGPNSEIKKFLVSIPDVVETAVKENQEDILKHCDNLSMFFF